MSYLSWGYLVHSLVCVAHKLGLQGFSDLVFGVTARSLFNPAVVACLVLCVRQYLWKNYGGIVYLLSPSIGVRLMFTIIKFN